MVDQLRTIPRNGTVHCPQIPLVKAVTVSRFKSVEDRLHLSKEKWQSHVAEEHVSGSIVAAIWGDYVCYKRYK